MALRDTLVTVTSPLVEVQASNVRARQEFRHHSYLSAIATGGVIVGCGIDGHRFAIERIASLRAA